MKVLTASRAYPISVGRAFDLVLPMPLPVLFARRYGPVPPVVATEQVGTWGVVGQQRRVILQGPGAMLETLTEIDRPHRFSYVLEELTGPLALLVHHARGSWAFTSAGTGTRITWSWEVTPRGAVGRAAMPAFGRWWAGYADRALATLERHLVES